VLSQTSITKSFETNHTIYNTNFTIIYRAVTAIYSTIILTNYPRTLEALNHYPIFNFFTTCESKIWM